MSDTKVNGFSSQLAEKYEKQLSRSAGISVADKPVHDSRNEPNAKNGAQVGSWDAYRNWLTKVQAPDQKRSLPDPALFSWKGYRSWAEKVRRDWEPES